MCKFAGMKSGFTSVIAGILSLSKAIFKSARDEILKYGGFKISLFRK
ncbi:hypothetical protein [Campylobacter rectus]|nr:hypothetical protein [Campylobacter rectus]